MTDFSKFTDHELAAILKEGDPLVYTEIFDRYKVILYKHAFQMLNSQEEANDVIQDVFLALWDKRDTLNLKTSLSAYLYSSVRNRIFDLISHQKVVSRYMDSIRDFIAEGSYTADGQVREKQLASIIEKEIAALPLKMRVVFELRRQDELSYKQIGQQLNISDKTVKQQVHNAVKILRLKLATISALMLFLFF